MKVFLILFFNLDQFLRLDVFQKFYDLRNITMISLTSKFEDFVNILSILPKSTRILILIFNVNLDMQFLMLFFVLFSLDIFCLRKFAHFKKVTLAVFEAVLLYEFFEE